MTRFAPILTLLAVAVVGGALLVTTTTMEAGRPQASSAAAAPTAAGSEATPEAPAEGGTDREIDLSELPVVGAEDDSGGARGDRTEIDLGELPVAGAAADAGGDPSADRTEIDLGDLEIAGAGTGAEDGAGAGAEQDTGGATGPSADRTEIDLGDLDVAGGTEPDGAGPTPANPERTEIELSEIEVVPAPGTDTEDGPADGPTGDTADDPASPAEDVLYAGRTADGEMTVAVAISGGKATAYVCDGGAVEAWFTGTVQPGTFTLKPNRGSARMTAALTSTGLEGTVDIGGARRQYTAKATDLAAALDAGRDDVGDVAGRAGVPS